MKKINLNIKLDKPIKNEKEEDMKSSEVAVIWIGRMIERAINKPLLNQRTGIIEPTANVNMEVQRKYNKIMDALENNKKGIAELDNDDFDFLSRKFQNQAEISLQRDVNKILIAIDDAINKAKIKNKEETLVTPEKN